jgi:hypothetical protein
MTLRGFFHGGPFVIRWATLSEAGLIAAATAAVFYEVGNLAQPNAANAMTPI